ncbi:arylformamidase [Peribacillus psychrosaccharolyticus]
MMSDWIDISQALNTKTVGWPGDTSFSYNLSCTKAESGSVNVGNIKMSTHFGTHIDAPFHFDDHGKKVHELDLDIYIGPALIIEWKGNGTLKAADFKNIEFGETSRVLIRTNSWKDRSAFPQSIPSIDLGLPKFLAEKGIRLLGLDLPSVDQLDSKDLQSHHELAKNGIHILEGLVLENIELGWYELSALPLSLTGADGSPVRAVVRKLSK